MISTNKPLNRAFTLIELLLVVILLSVVAGMVVPNIAGMRQGTILNRAGDDLAFTLRFAQSRAITSGRVHQVRLDEPLEHYWIMEQVGKSETGEKSFERVSSRRGRMTAFAQGIKVMAQEREINCFPNGTIDPVEIRLTWKENNLTVSTKVQRGQVYVIGEQSAESQ